MRILLRGRDTHHRKKQRCRRRVGPERSAVDGRSLRLVHLDPEQGEVVRHLLDAESRVVSQVSPFRLQGEESV